MRVSIVTINYNNREGLARTIRSVITQDYPDLEYIVIDGGSDDGSQELIEKHKDRIHYAVSEKDGGVYDAQNKGLKQCTGDYVLVLNSGDELAGPSVLSGVFSLPHDKDILYGNMIIVYPDGRRETGHMPAQIGFEHMMRDTLWHPVSFVKKSFLGQVGLYDTSYRIVADYEWFLRAIFQNNAALEYLNETISVFYLGGLSSDPQNAEKLKAERLAAQRSVFGEEKVKRYYATAKQPKRSFVSKLIKRLGL